MSGRRLSSGLGSRLTGWPRQTGAAGLNFSLGRAATGTLRRARIEDLVPSSHAVLGIGLDLDPHIGFADAETVIDRPREVGTRFQASKLGH